MTSALIIILREVLEAMLIISLLLAASGKLGILKRWICVAVFIGLLGAGVYAHFFDVITDAFEGVGQEITNATTLFAISGCLALFNFYIVTQLYGNARLLPHWAGLTALIGSIALAITREGAEISIYFSGYLLSPEPLQPVIIGSALGAGIGLSAGALIYYALNSLKHRTSLFTSSLVLLPVAAGMVSQGVNYLMQADIVAAQFPLWDSSSLVPEGSVVGELLYALFSYEATPTPLQIILYLVTVVLIALGMFLIARMNNADKDGNASYA